jgi:hypothetical protein
MGTKGINKELEKVLGKPWRHKLHKGWWLRKNNTNLRMLGEKCYSMSTNYYK